MRTGCAPTELLADYAAGALSPGMTLVLASHLCTCRCCRDKAARLVALGGALLADAPAAQPGPDCLERALSRIGLPAPPEPPGHNPDLPRPICGRLERAACDLAWRPVAPGLAAWPLAGCPGETVGLVHAEPGARLPPPDAGLVLAGSLDDGRERYGRGDLLLPGTAPAGDLAAAGPAPCLSLFLLGPATAAASPLAAALAPVPEP